MAEPSENYIIKPVIDVHCHLNFHSFSKDYDVLIKKALIDGVDTIINVGTSIEASQKTVELANKYENLFAIVGIHPHHADKLKQGWEDKIEELAGNNKVVGIGEIGLDYYSYKSNGIVDPKQQKQIFTKQIEIAHKLNLPLQIHNRQAGNDILEILEKNKNFLNNKPPGMFHCMSGNVDFLNKVLDLGFFVGFDGNITYAGIAKGEDTPLPILVKNTPINRIVTETDAPFLTPEPHRGSRNIPSYAIIVAETIAKIKGLEAAEVKTKTTENAKNIFNLIS